MYYSLTFNHGERNTWEDWGLIAESPPMIPPPTPNFNLVTVPGRREGAVDLSRVPFGRLTYQRVTGSWTFAYLIHARGTRFETFEEIRKWLHGRTATVATEDDPLHYHLGIFTVGEPKSGANHVEIAIGYDLEPMRWNRDGSKDTDYIQEYEGNGRNDDWAGQPGEVQP